MKLKTVFWLLSILLVTLAAAARPVLAGPPGPIVVNGQKVITLISRDPPGVRCNNNIQVAAELSNVYKVPFVVIPVSLAGPGAKAPAVYYGDQLLAVDGGDFNGMISYAMLEGVLEIEGALKQAKTGRLLEVKKDHDSLKAAIKGN